MIRLPISINSKDICNTAMNTAIIYLMLALITPMVGLSCLNQIDQLLLSALFGLTLTDMRDRLQCSMAAALRLTSLEALPVAIFLSWAAVVVMLVVLYALGVVAVQLSSYGALLGPAILALGLYVAQQVISKVVRFDH